MSLKTIPCRLCGKPIEVAFEEPLRNQNFWLSRIVCTPCADYWQTRRVIFERLRRLCQEVIQARNRRDSEELLEVLRPHLVKQTKAWADLVCRRHHKTVRWEPDFAEQLLDHPQDMGAVLRAYHHQVCRE